MRRLLPLLMLAALVAGACGGDKDAENASKDCGPPPTATAGGITLPASFPVPTGVTMISSVKQGPSTVLEGYSSADLGDVYTDYKQSLDNPPFSVTKSEKDDHDAEVNFESAETTGQVKLQEACKDRTSVTVTVRPK
jgi:hypothetical protein